MHPRFFPVVSLLAAVMLTAEANAAAGPNIPAGAYRLSQAKVIDSQGFGRPMTAATLFVPAGWTSSGGIVWQTNPPPSCGKAPTRYEWTATSPDGVSAIQILSEETWSGHNLPLPNMQASCPNVRYNNVRDFLQWYVQRERPGARVLDFRERPEIVAALAQYNRTDSSVGGEMRSWVQGGEVLLAYERQGRDMRETVAVGLMFFLNRMAGVMPGEIREFHSLAMLAGLAVRAPHGQLDFRLTETVRRSFRTDPEWSALMAEHNRKMSAISAKGAADRHAIIMDTHRDIAAINQKSYEDRQASQDRTQERFSQTIRGVETYVDSSSQERVELPNTYNNVWRLNDGSFILTDDNSFQPGRDLGVDGRQLEAAR